MRCMCRRSLVQAKGIGYVTADGQFIMVRDQDPPDEPVATLSVVLGWAEELKTKVPSGK